MGDGMSSEWPEGWYRDGAKAGQPPAGATGAPPAKAPASPHGSAWPEQPPARRDGRPAAAAAPPAAEPRVRRPVPGGPGGPGGIRPPRRRFGPKRIFAIIGVVVALLLIVVVGLYFYFNSQLDRKNVLLNYSGRPASGSGTNWLITGSDSRQGLTGKEENVLATGHDISGHRSDTVMILHIPSGGGRPLLISIPRDSYVPIPGHGSSKINAAYAYGGPKLLAKTVQNATGLRIDHYMGIGFGGLVHVVDAIGGVHMCLPGPMKDPKAGLNLKAGCQTLSGDQALGFVRTRNFAISDLQREQDQRLFLKALLSKMTAATTIINPFAAIPAANGAAGSMTVDQGTSLYNLMTCAFALRNPQSTTVPIANANLPTADGSAVEWNATEAHELFSDLNNGTKVPHSLISGSKVSGTG
jgi:LCP family protein required for cell wall assembly